MADKILNKKQFIKRTVKTLSDLSTKDAETAVEVFFDAISDALKDDGRVEIRGLGAFSLRKREPRIARNPKTNETFQADATYLPYFRASKEVLRMMNGQK